MENRITNSILVALTLLGLACTSTRVIVPAMVITPVDESAIVYDFRVNLNILTHESTQSNYPVTYTAIDRALKEWEKHVPVKFDVYMELENPPFGITGITRSLSPVRIIIGDLQSPQMGYEHLDRVVGLWDPVQQRLLFDGDTLEIDSEMAYIVALHEVGHMLGVPHIVSDTEEFVFNGYIRVKDNASGYVMYPNVGNSQTGELSQIEIDIATNHVKHHMTGDSVGFGVDGCRYHR